MAAQGIHDHPNKKLGCDAPVYDPKGLLLADYVRVSKLKAAPAQSYWGGRLSRAGWSMALNDKIGNCTIAAAVHLIEMWTADVNKPQMVSDADNLAAYEAISGYTPTDPSTDVGCNELDVLTYWRDKGIGGHKILGHMAIEPTNKQFVYLGINFFGAVYIGVALPVTVQKQQYIWSVVPNSGTDGLPGSWGGHAIPIIGYSQAAGMLIGVSWGALVWLTDAFWTEYVQEVYAAYSPDWISSAGVTPVGLDNAAMEADLAALAADAIGGPS